MHLHQIEYFLAVVDNNGINAAANALGLAQPTVSQAIRGLERELGVQLFHRIGRGMVLTSAGHSLVGPARRVLRGVVAAEGSVLDVAGRPRGRLDIVAVPALSADPLARLVGNFRQEFPAVSIRIGDLRDESAGTTLIRDGHCEILVSHLPTTDSADLAVCELGVQDWWLVFPPGAEVPPDDPLPLSALPDDPHVVVPRGGSQAGEIEQAVATAGRVIRPAVVVQHREARLPLVLAGVGATFLERSMAEASVARGAVARATEPRISRAFGLVFDPSALSPAGQAFVELARSSAPRG
jgi:DNA-binding transcriptional LysR family regulator